MSRTSEDACFRNFTEEVVERTMASVFAADASLCSCKRCQNDIRALALNALTPQYYVSERSRMLARMIEAPSETETAESVNAAVRRVKAIPRHSDAADSEAALINYSEEMVWRVIHDVVTERKDICSCPQCLTDTAAITLNDMRPRYHSTLKGRSYSKLDELDQKFYAECWVTVFHALTKVSTQPHHNREKSDQTGTETL